MRPLIITLEGFSAYRNLQTMSLEDVEFFSLSGPTGSGKSSLIDAMIFALYGRVPRLGARAVAPVITAGADRARVSLEFEVDDEAYVVSRVAERTDSGAAVREARLEKADGTSLASGAGEVTRKVEELLHLHFDDFTKTVVLPQGEFARFLNAGSKERRDLLRDLLGLDVYTRVRELANERKAEAGGRVSSARSQLESLDVPELEDLGRARTRLDAIQQVFEEIGGQLAGLQAVEASLQSAGEEIDNVDHAGLRLREIIPPQHLDESDEQLIAARDAEMAADKDLMKKNAAAEALTERISQLPSEESMANTRRAHDELTRLDERIDGLDVDGARATLAKAEIELGAREAELVAAQEMADAARVDHAAHTVGASLVLGQPCPVCAQEVETIPDVKAPPELSEVEDSVASAKGALTLSRERLQAGQARLTEIEARLSELAEQREAVVRRVAEAPSLDELAEAEHRLAELKRSLREARSEVEDLETARRRARSAHEDAAEAVRSVGRALMVAREQVADLKPPHSESDDPTVQWKDFLAWRDTAIEDLAEKRQSLHDDLERQQAQLGQMHEALEETLASVDVPAEKPYDVTVARELEVARNRVSKMDEVIERSKQLEAQLEGAGRTEAVAGALAHHLRANGFERWLMAGAIAGLVNGANELLTQLSSGGYSLEADEDGSFRIIDHRNADEIRDVATLSGGETFLVSLALSLSLAETLSASGGAGLDAIILDEGFGSLDEESLDVVAAVLEELTGRGLMVGVITHVKELAARAPVRYQVTREPEGSRVEVLS